MHQCANHVHRKKQIKRSGNDFVRILESEVQLRVGVDQSRQYPVEENDVFVTSLHGQNANDRLQMADLFLQQLS